MRKRLVSLLLCLVLIAGLLPLEPFTEVVKAWDELYRTENVEVPEGWDYVEVSTREKLEEIDKQNRWSDKDAAEGTFIRLTADIHVEDTDVSRDAFSLIYIALTRNMTIDFNGHTISGRIRAINNQDNKTWNTLNIKLYYGGVPDLTLRFVDSVGGGGITLDAETLVDGPSTALCITGDYLGDYSGLDKSQVPYDNGATVIIDGGTYKLNAKNQKFITSQLSGYVAFTDSEKKPCWDAFYNPFTRSAVGLTGVKSIINNGHFTADNNVKDDDLATQMGNRYVSALGLGSDYAVAGLTINGGKFDGSAYAVFFDNTWNKARQMPVLNGGTFSGGIMLCSTSGTWWKKTRGVYDMDNESRSWPVSRALKQGAVMTMDGEIIDPEKTKIETIGWPHEITIKNAPTVTEIIVPEEILYTGEKGRFYLAFSDKPEDLVVQEYVATVKNGKTVFTWKSCKKAEVNWCVVDETDQGYDIKADSFRIDVPAKRNALTSAYRVIAKYSNAEIVTDAVVLQWEEKPDFRFTLQPSSHTAQLDYPPQIAFDYTCYNKLKYVSVYCLKDGETWEETSAYISYQDEDRYATIFQPDDREEKEAVYKLVLTYNSPKGGDYTVDSERFIISWVNEIPEGACLHEGKLVGQKEASYDEDGYTGDVICCLCGTELSHGEVIPELKMSSVSMVNLTPYSEDPIYVHVGDTVTVSFDAVIDEDFLAQGNSVLIKCGYLSKGQYYSGKTDENGHCSVDITFYSEGTVYWNGYISCYDKDGDYIGDVDATIVFICDENGCNHDYQLISDTATCESDGLKYYQCSKCGAAKSEDSYASGAHIYGEGYSYNKDECYKVCLVCGEKKEVHSHDFIVKTEVPVNCTEADVTQECTRCHFVTTERKGGYNFHSCNANAGTYHDETHHWQYCTKCGEAIKELHTFDADDTCTNLQCYYHKGDLINSNKSDGNYMLLPAVACVHQTVTVDLSHVSAEMKAGSTLYWYCWSSNGKIELGNGKSADLSKLTAAQKASMHGKWLTVELQKGGSAVLTAEVIISYDVEVGEVAATCVHDGMVAHKHCPVCGGDFDDEFNAIDAVIPATGQHVYDNDCDPVCNACGTERTVQHCFSGPWETDSNGHFRHCSVCGVKGDYAAHEAGTWVVDVDPTCTEEGHMHLECETCGYVIVTDTIAPSHDYEKTIVPATCGTPGSITWVCLECGHTVSETIPALEHEIVFREEKKATCVSEGMAAHYECALCGTVFADKEGSSVLDAQTLVLEKNPENHYGIVYYGTNADKHWGICKCGATITEKEDHTFEEGRCTVCHLTKAAAEQKGADKDDSLIIWLIVGIGVLVVIIIGLVVVILLMRKKKEPGDTDKQEMTEKPEKAKK